MSHGWPLPVLDLKGSPKPSQILATGSSELLEVRVKIGVAVKELNLNCLGLLYKGLGLKQGRFRVDHYKNYMAVKDLSLSCHNMDM